MKRYLSLFLSLSILSTQSFAFTQSAQTEAKLLNLRTQLADVNYAIEDQSELLQKVDADLNEELSLVNSVEMKTLKLHSKLTKRLPSLKMKIENQVEQMTDSEVMESVSLHGMGPEISPEVARSYLVTESYSKAAALIPTLSKQVVEAGGILKFMKKVKKAHGRSEADRIAHAIFYSGMLLLLISLIFSLPVFGLVVALIMIPSGLLACWTGTISCQ